MHVLSDKELYRLCKKYGENALMWRRKFTGLLPEVNRRRLYERKGFSSIFEFAFKMAGLSEKQLRLALNLEERFKDKPALKGLLERGEASVNKLTRVASMATPENEEFWAEKVQQLSQGALETFVRDIKYENGLIKQKEEGKSLRTQNLNLAPDLEKELLELQQKGIDVNELLRRFLENRRKELAEEKEVLAGETELSLAKSRYIPVKIRRHLQKEHGSKCTINTCNRPSQEVHHTQRFALSKSHNPKYLAPICKQHHSIAHAIDVKVQRHKNS